MDDGEQVVEFSGCARQICGGLDGVFGVLLYSPRSRQAFLAHYYRVRIADRKIELITTLKGVRRAIGPTGNTEISVAHDGSPVFTRDIGTQEIYPLFVKWP